jgi:hypothetical protein
VGRNYKQSHFQTMSTKYSLTAIIFGGVCVLTRWMMLSSTVLIIDSLRTIANISSIVDAVSNFMRMCWAAVWAGSIQWSSVKDDTGQFRGCGEIFLIASIRPSISHSLCIAVVLSRSYSLILLMIYLCFNVFFHNK